jgi:DNA-binding MarR family transcriptional regulator
MNYNLVTKIIRRGGFIKESIDFLLRMAKIQNRINSNDKKPRMFGTKHLLYQSEIHFIDAVEPGNGLIASVIAKKLGITNGAVTQIADKLVKKNLIEKYKAPGNKKEVFIRLTAEGEVAYANHKLFHKKLTDKMIEYLDGLNKEQMEALFGIVEIVDKNLPDLNKEE